MSVRYRDSDIRTTFIRTPFRDSWTIELVRSESRLKGLRLDSGAAFDLAQVVAGQASNANAVPDRDRRASNWDFDMSGEAFAAQHWDLLCKILATRL
jgi:hypothetical protein